jgi:DNA-binding response OmpR family regulator
MQVLIIEERKLSGSPLRFHGTTQRVRGFYALSCREGMSLLGKVPFDMVLCENHLPDGNGFEMLKTSQVESEARFCPDDSHSDELLKEEAEKAGIRGFLENPSI